VSWIDLFLAKTMPFVQEGKTDLGDSNFSPENGLPDPEFFRVLLAGSWGD
jgi:hypothetical protein